MIELILEGHQLMRYIITKIFLNKRKKLKLHPRETNINKICSSLRK